MFLVVVAVVAVLVFAASPQSRRRSRNIAHWVVVGYSALVGVAVVDGLVLVILLVIFPASWLLAPLAFIEAVFVAFLLYVSAVLRDVEAEARSFNLWAPSRDRLQRERIRRAEAAAAASRRWAVMLVMAVFIFAASPRVLPLVKQSPLGQYYEAWRKEAAIVNQQKTPALVDASSTAAAVEQAETVLTQKKNTQVMSKIFNLPADGDPEVPVFGRGR